MYYKSLTITFANMTVTDSASVELNSLDRDGNPIDPIDTGTGQPIDSTITKTYTADVIRDTVKLSNVMRNVGNYDVSLQGSLTKDMIMATVNPYVKPRKDVNLMSVTFEGREWTIIYQDHYPKTKKLRLLLKPMGVL